MSYEATNLQAQEGEKRLVTMSNSETLAVYAATAEKKAAQLRLQMGMTFNPAAARKVRAEAERREAYAAHCRKVGKEESVTIWFDSWGNACNPDYTYLPDGIREEFRRKLNAQSGETDWAAASRAGIVEIDEDLGPAVCWAYVKLAA